MPGVPPKMARTAASPNYHYRKVVETTTNAAISSRAAEHIEPRDQGRTGSHEKESLERIDVSDDDDDDSNCGEEMMRGESRQQQHKKTCFVRLLQLIRKHHHHHCILYITIIFLAAATTFIILEVVKTLPLSKGTVATQAVCPRKPQLLNLTLVSSLSEIDFDHKARLLSKSDSQKINGAHFGFTWNEADGKTSKWRPQGITSFRWSPSYSKENDKKKEGGTFHFVAVSWYGRKNKGYENRGARISLVDVTDMPSYSFSTKLNETVNYRYRHILLVDENFCTFPGIHAGGIAYRDGKIHVPDSDTREDGLNLIHVFDITKSLFEVASSSPVNNDRSEGVIEGEDERDFFNYQYILQKEYTYTVPIKPSFLSFDYDRDLFLVGAFDYCGGILMRHSDTKKCRDNNNRQGLDELAWYTIGNGHKNKSSPTKMPPNSSPPLFTSPSSTLSCGPFFSDMQGAVSAYYYSNSSRPTIRNVEINYNNRTSDSGSRRSVILVSSSYGRVWPSHLHSFIFDPYYCNNSTTNTYSNIHGGDLVKDVGNYRVFTYPPGLEDLHIEPILQNDEHHARRGGDDTKRIIWMLTEFRPYIGLGKRMVFATYMDKLLPL